MIDNYDLFAAHDAEQARRMRHLPICTCCEEPIQQTQAVRINGDFYCDVCLEDMKEDIEEW